MAIGRLVRSAIKYGPIAYPIIRKVMNNRKRTTQTMKTMHATAAIHEKPLNDKGRRK
ncbi:hypothetical protein [Planococcus sp. MB-3u-03]|uniref:hypothetical protein n=1 Tax=Planococcus sp. MB-3u-03 TaxID=2058136 RepID=UPI0012FEBAED|nr:hypothetical protein [Planococcus sp. MB-3u-03]